MFLDLAFGMWLDARLGSQFLDPFANRIAVVSSICHDVLNCVRREVSSKRSPCGALPPLPAVTINFTTRPSPFTAARHSRTTAAQSSPRISGFLFFIRQAPARGCDGMSLDDGGIELQFFPDPDHRERSPNAATLPRHTSDQTASLPCWTYRSELVNPPRGCQFSGQTGPRARTKTGVRDMLLTPEMEKHLVVGQSALVRNSFVPAIDNILKINCDRPSFAEVSLLEGVKGFCQLTALNIL